ncbi:MAG TPA: PEP-utilizing enzyme, partial [Enhygromyxa sp.]|nr:PEP-utilizing enzyme [Enhygromyxa sp.]
NLIGDGAPLSPELRGRLAELLRGLGELESADVGVELEQLARALRADPDALAQLGSRDDQQLLAWLRDPASGAIGRRFSQFLQRHGHRCVRELELREVPWAADPTPVLASLRVLATAPDRATPPRRIELDELPVTPRIRRAIRWLLPKVHESIRLRERCKSLAVHAVRMIEPCCVAIGEQLIARGSLPELDLIYFLTYEELLDPAADELARIALRRRRVHAQQSSLRFAMVHRDEPRPLPPPTTRASARRMTGTPVSPGVVEGLARVARTPVEAAALRPGEVLIVPFTDAGWTPYFNIAAGLATEIGGTLSHGSVIARELGLPAVVDLPGATECFRTGQRVRLDANHGVLEPLDPANVC